MISQLIKQSKAIDRCNIMKLAVLNKTQLKELYNNNAQSA